MKENPYQPPAESDEKKPIPVHDTEHRQVPDHRFWIALAICPSIGPILTIFSITGIGFLYQASGVAGSEEVNPISLIFFPIVGLLVLMTANYIAMGLTFIPLIIRSTKLGNLSFTSILRAWLLSVGTLVLTGAFIGTLTSLIYSPTQSSEAISQGFGGGLSAGTIFIPTTMISAIGFWMSLVRNRVINQSKI
jgi:hypothetical protein